MRKSLVPLMLANTDAKIKEKFNMGPEPYILPAFVDGTREDLASLFAELGYVRGVEVGVSKGYYSEVLCKTIPNLQLTCVDPWIQWNTMDSDQIAEEEYQHALKILAPYNVKFMRMKSRDAHRLIGDSSQDFVYIDANPAFCFVMRDILDWIRRVRIGGILAGGGYRPAYQAGIITAVDAYARGAGLSCYYVTRDGSWFWVRKR